MKVAGKKHADGSIELSVQFTREEASAVQASADDPRIFGSKSEYCVTCTSSTGPVGPPETIEAYGDVHAHAIAFAKCGTYSLQSGRCK
jgi:hypothetical protein